MNNATLLHARSMDVNNHITVQSRSDKQHVCHATEANRIHGLVVTWVTCWSTYEEPFMLALPFTERNPFPHYLDVFYRRSHATVRDNSDGADRADILA